MGVKRDTTQPVEGVMEKNILSNAQKCEALAGFIKDNRCNIDEAVLLPHITCESLDGRWANQRMSHGQSMTLLGASKGEEYNNWKICSFPLENTGKIEQDKFDRMEIGMADVRTHYRTRYNNADEKRKENLLAHMMITETLIQQAKKIVEHGKQHTAMMFTEDPVKGITINELRWNNDIAKAKMLTDIRVAITKGNIKNYWIIMEAWVGKNPLILPRHDAERTEEIFLGFYEKDDVHSRGVHLPFERKDGKIIWTNRTEHLTGENAGDRWNFFMEDVMDERIDKAKLMVFERDMEKARKDFIDKMDKRGIAGPMRAYMLKELDEQIDDAKKSLKRKLGSKK